MTTARPRRRKAAVSISDDQWMRVEHVRFGVVEGDYRLIYQHVLEVEARHVDEVITTADLSEKEKRTWWAGWQSWSKGRNMARRTQIEARLASLVPAKPLPVQKPVGKRARKRPTRATAAARQPALPLRGLQ